MEQLWYDVHCSTATPSQMMNLVFLPTENKGLIEYGPLMAKNVFRFIVLQIYYIFHVVHLGIRENKFVLKK